MSTENALYSWVCQCCLTDAANINDTDTESELKFNFAQESEQGPASDAMNYVCPVCSMKSIPVNG